MKIRARTTGIDRWERLLRRYPREVWKAAERGLNMEAEFVMTDAKELTPVDVGNLRATGFVEPPVTVHQGRRTRITVTLGFGGTAGSGNQGESNTEDVGYAVPVHEDCDVYHEVGQCKYLETPVRAAEKTLPRTIAREMSKVHRRMRR